jgi:hypothetical protein
MRCYVNGTEKCFVEKTKMKRLPHLSLVIARNFAVSKVATRFHSVKDILLVALNSSIFKLLTILLYLNMQKKEPR